ADFVGLKGGDPLLFGRGGGEALSCLAAGIPFEIVPGISSACAAPAYAGIPLTQRKISSSVTIFTGHDLLEGGPSRINYEALSRIGGTLVILMAVRSLPRVQRRLLDAGLDPETPAAAIEWGSIAEQRVIEAPLAALADAAAQQALCPPATIVIGEVVRLRGKGLRWFDLPNLLQEDPTENDGLRAILEVT
ncbi:MAG: SAM-dependent methyltransferase, partial [Anaerolineaceae bacterium]|nr:SAM-dependent methyltransferase [Anaerolineaceae bacterium]